MKIIFGIFKYFFLVLVVLTFSGSVVGFILFMYFSRGLPNIISVEDYKPLITTQILDRNQTVVGEYFEERRYVVPIEKIPSIVMKAFVAAEDDRFFEHQGIDLHGILRAALVNFKAGKVVQGGSTITQQVAKSLLLTPERSFFRKIKEAILANRMEKNLSKKQILFLYLNQIYLGNGAYGVEAASRIYFNKELQYLTLAEAALLAGLTQAPSKYSPLINPKRAKERQIYVLHRLYGSGVIKQNEMNEAIKQKLTIYQLQEINEKMAPYYVEHVRRYLLEKYGKETLYKGGLTVQTPIDVKLSMIATKIVQENLRMIDKRQGYRGPIKKNKTKQQLQDTAEEVFSYNLFKKLPYEVLLPDGTYAKDLKDRLILVKNALEALDENEIYQALVLDINDARKEMMVDLGLAKAVLPMDQMKWARPFENSSDEMSQTILSRPSQILSKGDLIWVRLISKTGKIPIVALEQQPTIQAALLSMDVNTGAVIVMVGGYDYHLSEFNRAVQAARQPGSAYKPIIYAAALDKGYTPVTIIQDSPIVFNGGENEKWKPENYGEKFYGDTSMRLALIRSRNIPTIKIVQDIQVPYLIEYSKRLGITEHLNQDLSIALGSSSISLLDLLRVYAIFPRGGRRIRPIFINRVMDRYGKILEEQKITPEAPSVPPEVLPAPPKPVSVAGELQVQKNAGKEDPNLGVWTPDPKDPDRVMDPRTAYVVTHMMNEVVTIGTGIQAKKLGRIAAGKTGTTNDYLDAWFLGFIPQMITGVWVGYDNQQSIGKKATGGKTALPIWLDYMKEAVKMIPPQDFAVPKGVTFAFIDNRTGKLVGANRPDSVREAFVEGTEPGAVGLSAKPNELKTQTADSRPNEIKVPLQIPAEAPSTEEFYKKDIE